ncbi:hypothetical protein BKA67DRAFT_691015 [Truncatella angustata]|uniref:Uncharacterized protein n=1 Tax=Truncatella angustata TaxID=152316 RepID=A0A9P8UKT4_9PEZI|nr:uncharacterized protein BKA67DRAFT_691015 [Truncatella angustata]KAH6653911.1 hypothetical protein BKA67DRAFT_691015 [Truncatella angustata]
MYAIALELDFTLGTSDLVICFDATFPSPVVSVVESLPKYRLPRPSVIFSGYVTPSVTPSDSPEYTAEAKARSTDDKDFMAIYTYTEFEIILDATGLPPVASGDSGSSLVLDENLLPMVSRTGSVDLLLQPTTTGDPMLNPSTYTAPTFCLQAAEGTDGICDIIYGNTAHVPLRLPAGLVSYTKLDYTLGEGNLCEGLSDWWDLSPLDFGGACNVQILYYDMCEDFSWVGCNAILYIATLAVCSEVIGNDRWDVAALIACGVQAAYYTAVAETNTGCALYYKAPNAVCRCFCSGPLPTRHLDCGVSPSKRATWE